MVTIKDHFSVLEFSCHTFMKMLLVNVVIQKNSLNFEKCAHWLSCSKMKMRKLSQNLAEKLFSQVNHQQKCNVITIFRLKN